MDPREQAAQSMMQAGIGSLGGREIPHREYNKFQVRANEPEARALENYVFDWRREGGNYPMNIDSVPHGKGWKVQDRFLKPIEPMRHLNPNKWLPDKYKERQSAGIPATNQGYKVMNALSMDPSADDFFLRELFNYGKRYFPGYVPENDEWRQKKYRDSLPEENEFPTYDPDYFMMPPGGLPEDFPLEDIFNAPTLEANLSQTWQDIVDRTGNEDLANEWLATQQANRGGIIGLL